MVYAKENKVTGKKIGDKYDGSKGEWARGVVVNLSFSLNDLEEVREYIKISKVEYYDEKTKVWKDTGCILTEDNVCQWSIKENFDSKVKFKITNEFGRETPVSDSYEIHVDIDNVEVMMEVQYGHKIEK